jgi:hypothetical protein
MRRVAVFLQAVDGIAQTATALFHTAATSNEIE